MMCRILSYRWRRGILYLGMIGMLVCPLVVQAATPHSEVRSPVRPPMPTLTPDVGPPDLPGRPKPVPEETPSPKKRDPCAYIQVRVVVAAEAVGLGSVVQWQDSEDVWHNVEGWQGPLEAGQKAWWLSAPLFGAGPFRWVITRSPGGSVVGMSDPFWLPEKDGAGLIIEMDMDDVILE